MSFALAVCFWKAPAGSRANRRHAALHRPGRRRDRVLTRRSSVEEGNSWSEIHNGTRKRGYEPIFLVSLDSGEFFSKRVSDIVASYVFGRCVDSGEYLGGPLTKYIDTFVGVAGPNHGISLQVGGVAIPGCVFSVIPVCNQVTGLYSGFCPSESEFLQDINSQVGYEGKHIFTIHSKKDQIVGHIVCNRFLFYFQPASQPRTTETSDCFDS
ncbi:triacylglycerol lipase [Ancylostoma caninum]|uniref:Triacylglycerol lipase n=1 Tax=Ancylostoma caninum TaxID=29170 RepID=A0A368FGK5_ANCCA|nr:triacylglycerol lipase [Ancylostoma caninum]